MENSKDEKTYVESVLNWTFPGIRFYYRDTDSDSNVEETYKVGQILRAGFFIDVSAHAKRPCSRIRFIIASSHIAELYKTTYCEPAARACELCVLHPHSYFKVMDVFKVGDQYQVFLLHIPFKGVPLFQDESFDYSLGLEKTGMHFVYQARKSFEIKLQTEADENLESARWKERTKFLVGKKTDGSFFSLNYSLIENEQCGNVENGLRDIAGDEDPLNLPDFPVKAAG